MANDKKFIVKNGLLTPENAVIGSTTDTGEKLQVTGDTVLTQGTQATPTLKVTNSGGHSAATIVAQFEGDSDSLQIRNFSAGDYSITNPQQSNEIRFYDGTAGIEIRYAGSKKLAFTSTGTDFTGLATTTIESNRILTTADEGAGNGLDADTVDGLQASQFIRSDIADSAAGTISFLQDIDVTGSAQIDTNITIDGQAVIKALLDAQANAQVAGNLSIGGNLIVSGNTTTVNTEEIKLADNIITLNSNYTGSSPSENGGIEVERGTLANPKLVWNEAQDYWQLEVNNAVLGRVITTADEGSGNGFDADTVDGLEAAQFLRSDADDTATGNITIEGDITVGNGSGAAQINFATTGQDRVLYGDNGTIGFLKDDNSGWNASSDTDGDWNVDRDVEAGRDVNAVNDVTAGQDITATSGNISATAGDVTAGDDVIAQNNITATSGNIAATAGNVTAGQDVTAGDDMIAQNNITATSGNITATSGNISATAGDVTAGDDVIAQNNITATAGNISATAGSVSAGTTVTAGTDVIGQRFVDADNNSYLLNPHGTSTLNDVGIDDDLFHNGDTDTKLNFTTNQIKLNTGGTTRLDINNSRVLSNLDTYAPNLYINDAIVHNNDVDTKIVFTTDDISLQTGGAERLGVDNAGVDITGDLDVSGDITAVNGTFTGDLSASRFVDADNNSYFLDPNGTSVLNRVGIEDYIQHNGDTNTFFGFDSNDNIIFTTNAVERFEINATNITGTVDGIFPNLYAGRYYDLNNATYYLDPASNSRLNGIGLVGTIFHDGDTNTYLNFNAADSFEIVTGGTQRLQVTTFTTAAGSVRSPVFYDSNNTNYYGDFASASQMSEIDIDTYIKHRGDTDTYMGFPGNDSFRVVTGSNARLDINNSLSTFYTPVTVQGDVQADRFVDRNATGYFVHPGDTTLAATFAGAVRIENISDNSRWADTSGNGGIALMGYGDANGTTSNPSIAISGNVSGGYALQYMNLIDSSANPVGNGQRYIHFYHDGVDGGSIRGDSSGNLYQVLKSGTTWGFWNSGYTEALIVDDNANVMVATGSAPTYTDGGDNTALTTTPTNPKLHVGGSIYLNGNNDAIIFGRGTASFLKDEELAFGWGGGLYMQDSTYLRIRNNKTVYSTGDIWASRFYAHSSTSYYLDPDGDSQLNTVDIDDYVRHRGDTNTYMGFNAADQIQFVTNASNRLQITNSTVRARNKLEVYGSGIELQKQSNGGGVGITMTDQSGELPGLSGKQQASIKVWHADSSVTTGAQLAMVFDSSETAVHYVFGQLNGTQGASIIPRVNAQGNLGISTYRWGNAYITSGDFVNLTVTNEISAPGVSGYANYLKSRDNRIIAPSEDTSGRLRFGFTSWNNNNTAPYADYLHFRSYTDSSGGPDNLLMIKKSGLGMRLWQQTWNSGTAYSNYVDFPLYNVNPGTGNDFYANKFIDIDNTAYFADPAGESRLATIKLEDGVILRSPNGTFGSLTVSGTGRSGYEGFSINDRAVFMHNNSTTTGIYNDVNNHWLIRTVHGAGNYFYYNGTQQASAESGYFLGQNQVRSPIFYDSGNTGYYADFASTTRLNAIQALRYYFNHATTYYADAASGNYGSMEVGGYKSGWAGYSIAGQWVFMSDGPSNAGIYNDTDNEWSILARRNAEVELYYNGTEQASTQNGYFFAQNQMRAPIYYDSNNTAYYSNQGSGNTSTAFRTNGIYDRLGFDTSGNGNTNILMRAQDYTHWIWQTASNWGIMWAGNTNPVYSHFSTSNPNEIVFVGAGNVRASIDLDNGNAYFQGSVSAGNFELNGGNENISLNPAYGSGGADLVLFDMTPYFEARVIQNIDDNENFLTGTTSEYVKGDGPFAGGYVLRSAAYRNFYSNLIPVSPGEDIYGEISTRLISGSGGLLYYGVERYDKDKRPIAGNTGTTYFVVGGSNRTSTSWETLRAHTTMPTSHTPYNGSDGGGVHYVRIRILLNYNSGGALREYGGIMLKRRNAESNLLVDDLLVSDQLTVNGNATIVGDLTVDDITADVIDANIFRDRSNTGYYVDPASTGTSVNVRGVIQNPSIWINDGNEVNSYNENIRLFNASNGVSVIAFSATGTAGAPATSILGYSDRLETRRVNDWQQRTYLNRVEFAGDIRPTLMYDRNDTSYYLDPNSNGRMLQLGIGLRAGGKRLDVTGDHGNTAIRLALTAGNNGAGTGEIPMQWWVSEPGNTWDWGGFGYNVDNNLNHSQTSTYYFGRPNTTRGQAYMRFSVDGHTYFYNTNTSGTRVTNMEMYSSNYIYVNNYLQAGNSLRAPIFYDSNNTGYYTDQASTSIHNVQRANYFSHTGNVSDASTFGLYFAVGRSTAYAIYKEGGPWTNPYPDLRIAFHTGIKFGAAAGYNGMRFYTDYDMVTQVMSVNNGADPLGGSNVYVNNSLQAGSSLRAPIFYDSNDTTYFLDPNTTGRSLRARGEIFLGPNSSGRYTRLGGNGGATDEATVSSSNGNLHLDARSGHNIYLAWYNTSAVQVGGVIDATQFRDRNNTGYYGDFASTSYMNDVRANIFYERENTAYYFGSSQGDARFRDIRTNNIRVENGVTIESVNGSGRIYLGGNLHIDAQNSNDIYLNYYSGRRTRMYAPGQVEAARLDTNRLFYAFYDFRAPIFYDYNDTTYRVDPNGTSVLRRLTINETLNGYQPDNFGRFRWSTGYFNNGTSTANFIGDLGDNEALSQGFTAQKVPWSYAGNSDVNTGIQNIEMAGSSLATWHDGSYYTTLVIRPTTGASGGSVYIYNNQGSGYAPGWRQVATSSTDFFNYNSIRSPIFYDNNNTGYYGDFASTSNMNTVQINGTVRFMNFGLGVTGTYTSTRLQTIFNMDDQYSINAAGTATQNAYGLYWSHPNAGSLGGANNLNDHGLLIINNGSFRAAISSRAVFSSDVRGTLFYDYNNTGYYLDPAGASNLNTSVRANEFYARNWFRNDNSGEGLYNQATAMHWYSDTSSRFRLYSTSTTSQILFTTSGNNARGYVYATNSNEIGFLNSGGGWSLRMDNSGNSFHTASARAPIFYDNNDTTYYLDPNSTSNSALRIRGGALHGPNTTWGRYLAVGTNGRYNNEASVATTNGNLHLDSRSGNNTYIQWYVGGTTFVNGSLQADIFYDRNNTSYYGNFASTSYMNDVRANIFYERENTAYYFGSGQGDARFRTLRGNEIYSDNWFRNYGAGEGLYNQATGRHFYSPGSTYWHLDGASGSGGLIIYDRYNGSQGNATGRRGYLYYDSGGFGLLHSGGGWAFRISPSSTSTEQFGVSYMNDARAYILYDRDNTAYYFNGASVNSTRFEGVSNRTRAMFGNSGQTQNSAEYYSARPRITSDVRYWTGSMGWGRLDMNTVATWGSGFIDSWSNPVNQPSGTSHWVGIQAYHGNFSTTQNYGWQMVGGPITNLRFRSAWSGWRSWRTIPVLDENSTNGGSMYAGRYYDSNNTGYYIDPASTSEMNTTNHRGRFYFSNYVRARGQGGMMGDYNDSGTRAKVIWTIGDSWPIGNMYGLGYEYNGSYGHHLALKNNGTTYHRMSFASQGASLSGTWQASSSFRAPIWYDSNSTAYYIDAAGTSNTNKWTQAAHVRMGNAHHWITPRSDYTSDTNYHTGTFGWGTGAGTWATSWKGGFSGWDIWGGGTDHPQGSGYIHAQGIQSGQHYALSNGSRSYGWQMVGATNATANRYWARGKWSTTTSAWKEFAMYGGGGSGDLRANIFYDSDNTGYYVNANSSGVAVRIAGDIACDANYGKGIYGVYSSVRYQHVWSMGSSWRLPANGTTTGNLYGMAWSHPNRGGAAGNLDSHGLLILINGGFGSAMSYSIRASGNITAYSDERLKTNWKPMPDNFVSRLSEVRVGIYDRIDGEQITQVGVSAQSLEKLLPEAVTAAKDEIGTLSVNYGGAALASAVELAKAIKEQQNVINKQQQEITELKDVVLKLLEKLS